MCRGFRFCGERRAGFQPVSPVRSALPGILAASIVIHPARSRKQKVRVGQACFRRQDGREKGVENA